MPTMETAARLVRHHHERYDGLGYPDGLAGRDIPLGARVIAAVDAFDKVLHAREVFAAQTAARGVAAVRARTPAEFDPEVVAALAEAVAPLAPAMDRAVAVGLTDLVPGLVLADDLRTVGGVRLLPAGTTLTTDHLERGLRGFLALQERDPIAEPIRVGRRGPAAPGR